MKALHSFFGGVIALVATVSLGAQTPVLGNIEAPYPSLQSQVRVAGATYGPGSVAYGPVGTFLVLTGQDLGASGTVQFTPYEKQNNQEIAGTPVQATVTMWSPTILFLNVPAGAGSGLVTVTTEGRISNGLPFIVTQGTYSGSCPASPPGSQLQILTASLGNGKSGQPYSTTLSAEGGQTAYSWSILSGALPTGLSLNSATGTISGTPSGAAGPVDLSVQVKDSSSPPQTDDALLTITIDPQTLAAGTIYGYSLGHDYVGNVTSYSDSTYSGGSIMGAWSYGYDSLNRLESGTATAGDFSGQSACWAYDSFGNRMDQATSNQPFQSSQNTESCQPASGATLLLNVQNTYTINGTDPGTNQIQSTNASGTMAEIGHDAAGNVIADGPNQYLYDAEGRICAEMSPAPPSGGPAPMTGYIYDAEGNRIAKGTIASLSCDPSANGFSQTETYLLGQGGEELTQLDGGGNWQRTNVYATGALIGTYDTTGLHFQLIDPLGTRRMQASYQGQPETECQSWPYGDGLYCYPDTYAPPTTDDATPLHFTGKERDAESGLDYFGARYYGSSMGRMMSPDPMNMSAVFHPDDPQAWNGYAYARNNPLSITDPSGMNYQVCDANGQNCSNLDDKTFETDEERDRKNGEYFQNGSMFHIDADGNHVQDGTYKQTDVDLPGDPVANQQGLNTLATASKGVTTVTIAYGATYAVAGAAIAGAPAVATIARWGLQRLAMAATAPALVNLINRLYQAQDEIPGGTAGAVRNEIMTGEYINGGHAIKASEMITALQNLIQSGTLSGSDQMIAGHIISDLKNSLGR